MTSSRGWAARPVAGQPAAPVRWCPLQVVVVGGHWDEAAAALGLQLLAACPEAELGYAQVVTAAIVEMAVRYGVCFPTWAATVADSKEIPVCWGGFGAGQLFAAEFVARHLPVHPVQDHLCCDL